MGKNDLRSHETRRELTGLHVRRGVWWKTNSEHHSAQTRSNTVVEVSCCGPPFFSREREAGHCVLEAGWLELQEETILHNSPQISACYGKNMHLLQEFYFFFLLQVFPFILKPKNG